MFMRKISKIMALFNLFIVFIVCTNIFLGMIHLYRCDKKNSDVNVEQDFSSNDVLVVLNAEASLKRKIYRPGDFSSIKISSIEDLTQISTNAIVNNKKNDLVNYSNYKRVLRLKIKSNSKYDIIDAIKKLYKNKNVYYAGPNYTFEIASTYPNDKYVNNQWALDDAKISSAWDLFKGNKSVLVGVLDTGIDGTNSDLIPVLNKDLSRDFTSGEEKKITKIVDENGHGTHVAGIIGATGNNETGISGVNWNASLVSLRVSDENGKSSIVNLAKAISFAQQNDIKILNFSSSVKSNVDLQVEQAYNTCIANYNGLFITSAGNNGIDIDGDQTAYPASCKADNIIAVGSYNEAGLKSSFSNYGDTSVDIYAPGENILSTYIGALCKRRNYVFHDGTRLCEFSDNTIDYLEKQIEAMEESWEFVDENFSKFFDNSLKDVEPKDCIERRHEDYGFHYLSGTSMSAPYVAGVAALLLSTNSNLSTAEIKKAIIDSADSFSFKTKDSNIHYSKKLNAYSAISKVHTHQFVYESNSHIGRCTCDFTKISAHIYSNHYCTVCGVYSSTSHDYNRNYKWLNYTLHSVECSCGSKTNQGHAVSSGSFTFGQKYAKCLFCGGDAMVGFTEFSSYEILLTKKGSYILPNGVIVLNLKDYNDYINGKIYFVKKSNIAINN